MKTALLLLLTGTLTLSAAQRYISVSGLSVEADDVALVGDQVVLRGTDGKYVTFPAARLTPDSLAAAKKAAALSSSLASVSGSSASAPPSAPSSPPPATPAATTPARVSETPPPLAASAKGKPFRLEVRVNSGKSSRVSKTYSDDQIVRATYTVDVTNREVDRDLAGAQATLVVFGRNVVDPKDLVVLAHETFKLALDHQKSTRLTSKEVRTTYDDKDTYRDGYRLHGHVLVIKDSAAQVLSVSGSSPTLERVALAAIELKQNAHVDPEMKPHSSNGVLRTK